MNKKLESIAALAQANRIAEARKLCSSYLKKHKTDADGWFLYAGIQSRLNNMDEVIDGCRKALAINSGHSAASFNLGVALQTCGRDREAAFAYQQCLKHDKNNQSALNNLILTLNSLCASEIKSGNTAEAESVAKEILGIRADNPDVYIHLALIATSKGDFETSERHLKHALKLHPGFPQALNNLGGLYASTERSEQAIDCFTKAISADPRYAEAHNNMGLTWQRCGENEKALHSFSKAIQEQPDNAEFHNNAGNSCLPLGKVENAIAHYKEAIKLNPEYPEALNNLGNALLMGEDHREQYEAAEACYRKAIKLRPDMAEAYFNLGTCLHPQAKFEDALHYYEIAVELKPDYHDAISGISTVLEHLGQFENAHKIIAPLAEHDCNNINIAIAYGKLASRYEKVDQAIQILETIIKQELDTRNLSEAHFLLGKLYDTGKQFDLAFPHYQTANSIDAPAYHHSETVSIHERLKATFSSNESSSTLAARNSSRLPVFIVGMPRSGTSLVEQILSSHPDVFGAGELEDIGNISANLSSTIGTSEPYPECIDQANQQNLDAIATTYLTTLKNLGGDAKRITDKMPHNFQALGLIERLFPDAHVIHCVRNPVDTCLSIYFQHFNSYHAYSYRLQDLGIYYQKYLELMSYWEEHLSLPILKVEYETMVEQQEEVSRRMIEFIGLEWDDACLQFHKSDRIVATPSYDQVRQPMYRKSVARWKHYEEHIGELLSAL